MEGQAMCQYAVAQDRGIRDAALGMHLIAPFFERQTRGKLVFNNER
jgi:hypothetical protein